MLDSCQSIANYELEEICSTQKRLEEELKYSSLSLESIRNKFKSNMNPNIEKLIERKTDNIRKLRSMLLDIENLRLETKLRCKDQDIESVTSSDSTTESFDRTSSTSSDISLPSSDMTIEDLNLIKMIGVVSFQNYSEKIITQTFSNSKTYGLSSRPTCYTFSDIAHFNTYAQNMNKIFEALMKSLENIADLGNGKCRSLRSEDLVTLDDNSQPLLQSQANFMFSKMTHLLENIESQMKLITAQNSELKAAQEQRAMTTEVVLNLEERLSRALDTISLQDAELEKRQKDLLQEEHTNEFAVRQLLNELDRVEAERQQQLREAAEGKKLLVAALESKEHMFSIYREVMAQNMEKIKREQSGQEDVIRGLKERLTELESRERQFQEMMGGVVSREQTELFRKCVEWRISSNSSSVAQTTAERELEAIREKYRASLCREEYLLSFIRDNAVRLSTT